MKIPERASGQASWRTWLCPWLPSVAVVRVLQKNPGHEGTQEVTLLAARSARPTWEIQLFGEPEKLLGIAQTTDHGSLSCFLFVYLPSGEHLVQSATTVLRTLPAQSSHTSLLGGVWPSPKLQTCGCSAYTVTTPITWGKKGKSLFSLTKPTALR